MQEDHDHIDLGQPQVVDPVQRSIANAERAVLLHRRLPQRWAGTQLRGMTRRRETDAAVDASGVAGVPLVVVAGRRSP